MNNHPKDWIGKSLEYQTLSFLENRLQKKHPEVISNIHSVHRNPLELIGKDLWISYESTAHTHRKEEILGFIRKVFSNQDNINYEGEKSEQDLEDIYTEYINFLKEQKKESKNTKKEIDQDIYWKTSSLFKAINIYKNNKWYFNKRDIPFLKYLTEKFWDLADKNIKHIWFLLSKVSLSFWVEDKSLGMDSRNVFKENIKTIIEEFKEINNLEEALWLSETLIETNPKKLKNNLEVIKDIIKKPYDIMRISEFIKYENPEFLQYMIYELLLREILKDGEIQNIKKIKDVLNDIKYNYYQKKNVA